MLLADVRGQVGHDRAAHRARDGATPAAAPTATVLGFAEALAGPAVLHVVGFAAAAASPSATTVVMFRATAAAAATSALTVGLRMLMWLRAAVGLALPAAMLLLGTRRLHHKALYSDDRGMCERGARK